MFITFEGIDLSGKSTQIKLLEDYLKRKKKKVITVREPGGTMISEKIRDILLDKKNLHMENVTEFLLFSASRYQLVNEIILPRLKKNYYVLCDRYFDSSTAYQGFGGKVDLKNIYTINKIASANLDPDLTFLINISEKEFLRRKKAIKKAEDRIEQKKLSYYKKVIKGYMTISQNNKGRYVVIDGTKTVEEIHSVITDHINKFNKKFKKK
ncbi:MAG: dTMP kinase [Bacteroidetes bacterium]|nr:dTMP kinase [Bacteroidota bacterium]